MKKILSTLMVVSLVFSLFAMTAMAAAPTTEVSADRTTATTAGSDATYANKQMTILVFSGSLPSVAEASIKYIDQAASNPAGEYTFSYVVDAPTTTTGPYTVLVGGETLTTPLAAGTIPVSDPNPTSYTLSGSVAVNTGCKNPQNAAITVYKYNAVTDADENPVTATALPVASGVTFTTTPVSGSTVEASYVISGLSANTKYRVEIKKSSWVKYVTTITVGTSNVTLNKKTLYSGDFNNDNSVNLTDFGVLKSKYGKTTANDPDFNTLNTGAYRADANEDGSINLTDFGQLKMGFGKTIASYGTLQPN